MAQHHTLDRGTVAALCREFGVRRLILFGSALTDRFDEDQSDFDFVVEFMDDVESRFDAYFGLKEALERLTGRPVDLVSESALENPYFAESVGGGVPECARARLHVDRRLDRLGGRDNPRRAADRHAG